MFQDVYYSNLTKMSSLLWPTLTFRLSQLARLYSVWPIAVE